MVVDVFLTVDSDRLPIAQLRDEEAELGHNHHHHHHHLRHEVVKGEKDERGLLAAERPNVAVGPVQSRPRPRRLRAPRFLLLQLTQRDAPDAAGGPVQLA